MHRFLALISVLVLTALITALFPGLSAVAAGERQSWQGVLAPPLAVDPASPEAGFTGDAPLLLPRMLSPSLEDQVMELVNEERWNNGQLPPLKRNSLLDASSETHSFNMADRDFFAHCDLDTSVSPWTRIVAAGYAYASAAENIAAGHSSAAAVMNGWMNSSGHRANILSTGVNELGIGHYQQAGDQGNIRFDQNGDCVADLFNNGPYTNYWTQNFGSRASNYPVVIDREAFETDSQAVELYLYGSTFATEMRIRNENGSFGAWQAFSSDVNWNLSAGNGTKTVYVEIRSAGGTVRSANDSIELNIAANHILTDGFETGNLNLWTLPGV